MVALSRRFTLLAAFCSLASLSAVSPVDAAAVRVRDADEHAPHHTSSSASHHPSANSTATSPSHAPTESSKAKQASPSIPLPNPKGDAQTKSADSSEDKGKVSTKSVSASDEEDGADGHTHKKGRKSHDQGKDKERRWDPLHPLLGLGDFQIDDKRTAQRLTRQFWSPLNPLLGSRGLDARHHHDHHPEVIVTGKDDHVHYAREPHHRHKIVVSGDNEHVHLSREPHHHHDHHDHEKVVVSGDNDHVHLRRESHHHHHHHHHHHDDEKVVVSGDNDHVHLRRAPHHHHGHHDEVIVSGDNDHVHVRREPHHHHHHGHSPEKVIVSGDNDHVHLKREPHHHHDDHEKVVVSGDNDHVHLDRSVFITGEQGNSYIVDHGKRAGSQHMFSIPRVPVVKRDGVMGGVPGRIDIISPMANSSAGQRLASLVLASLDNESSNTSALSTSDNTFVLNASQGNQTQIYLVPLPPSANGTSMASSIDPEVLVALQLPVFDAASATLEPWCATFDPSPPAPAPLTAEKCFDVVLGGVQGEHKSQVFAFNPSTHAVRPMWFDGEDDGTDHDEQPSDSAAPVNTPMDGDPDSSPTGMDSAPVDPETPQSAFDASVTEVNPDGSAAVPDGTMSSSMSASATSPVSTEPSSTSASGPTATTAPKTANAQNVTLMFMPADPEVEGAAVPTQTMDMTTTVTSTSTSTMWATSTTASPSPSDSASGSAESGSSLMVSASTDSSTSTTSPSTTLMAAMADSTSVYPTASVSSMSSDAPVPSSSADGSAAKDMDPADSTPSTTSVSDSTTATSSTASPTSTDIPSGLLGVLVVPEAKPSSSAMGSSTASSSAASASMTPVSTAPYEWMFKPDERM